MSDSPLDQLVESFRKFPGIGPRQARRFVYHLLRSSNGTLDTLVRQIQDLKKGTAQCPSCGRYYPANKASVTQECSICQDSGRDAKLLMIVEKDVDLESVERADSYNGYYFVLGGLVPILEKEPARRVRAKELEATIKKRATNLQEVIIALSANPEGDYTADYIKKLVAAVAPNSVKISMLGRGLSTGTELEYSDADTLKNALKHRE